MSNTTTDKKALRLFFIIIVIMSVIFEGGYIISSNVRGTQSLLIMLGLMWTPGIAGIVTSFVYYKKQNAMGIRLGKVRYILLGIFIPFAYLGGSYVISWLLLGDKTIGLEGIFQRLGYIAESGTTQAAFIVRFLIVGLLTSCISALGEELGWRGFLYPVMERVLGRKRAVLYGGMIWACWHMPLIIAGLYQSETKLWYGLLMFAIVVTLLSGVMAWLRMVSGSVIPALMIHASHNLFDQSIFQTMSTNENVPYLAGEKGVITAICLAIIVTYYFSKKRNQDER